MKEVQLFNYDMRYKPQVMDVPGVRLMLSTRMFILSDRCNLRVHFTHPWQGKVAYYSSNSSNWYNIIAYKSKYG